MYGRCNYCEYKLDSSWILKWFVRAWKQRRSGDSTWEQCWEISVEGIREGHGYVVDEPRITKELMILEKTLGKE